MINTILLVNYCESTKDGFSGTAFTLAAGSKPSEKDAEELSDKVTYSTGDRDYLTLEIALVDGNTVTAFSGDMVIISDGNALSVVSNPSDDLRELILKGSGLEVHETQHKQFD